jgi:predicted PurR-regulated permease PerM
LKEHENMGEWKDIAWRLGLTAILVGVAYGSLQTIKDLAAVLGISVLIAVIFLVRPEEPKEG